MKSFSVSDFPASEVQNILQHAVAPRPIAFASTIDAEGNKNLSPFSFFNVFSSNPPVLIFSPARRVRDNTTKHTLENVLAVPEVVIGVVNYAMVQQMSLSSTEYEKGVNEFAKSGLTELPSQTITPSLIAESPVNFECKVLEVKPLGNEGGAGNLVICEVMMIHVDEKVYDDEGKIDQKKLDLVARLGGNWYSRTTENVLFTVPKPLKTLGIGVDQLPDEIRNSTIFTGNDLGKLANIEEKPLGSYTQDMAIHKEVQKLLEQDQIMEAWNALKIN